MPRRPLLLSGALLATLVAVRAPGAAAPAALAASDTAFAGASRASAGDATLLARAGASTLRVVTWNIGANSIVPERTSSHEGPSRPASFARVMRALDADVVCLQELTVGPARAAALFDRIRPLPNGARWQAVSELGNVLLSRYPLTERRGRTFRQRLSQRGHVIARVETPEGSGLGRPTVACMHLQAKGGAANLAFRQRHASAVVADLRTSPGPVIALGDMNAVDRVAPYLRTLEQGVAAPDDRSTPVAPDARMGFPLVAARAVHNGAGSDAYTWRNDRSGFAPGTLDYVLFSERGYSPRSAFVLNTLTLGEPVLAATGLQRADALRDAGRGEYDHLPVVVDLEPLGAR